MGAKEKSKSKPVWPSWITDAAKETIGGARDLYHDPSTRILPGMNPYTTQGLERRAGIANSGNTLSGPIGDEARRVLNGEYLDASRNPNFQRTINAAMGAASGRFANSGRVGSGAYAGAVADSATGAAASMYDSERQRQMQALSLSPQLLASQYVDSSQLEDVGRAYDEDAMNRFNWPYERLDRYTNSVNGSAFLQNPGQNTTTRRGFDYGSAAVGALNAYGNYRSSP
jgi:hypothetical protein